MAFSIFWDARGSERREKERETETGIVPIIVPWQKLEKRKYQKIIIVTIVTWSLLTKPECVLTYYRSMHY